jgi:hypothetical protein
MITASSGFQMSSFVLRQNKPNCELKQMTVALPKYRFEIESRYEYEFLVAL